MSFMKCFIEVLSYVFLVNEALFYLSPALTDSIWQLQSTHYNYFRLKSLQKSKKRKREKRSDSIIVESCTQEDGDEDDDGKLHGAFVLFIECHSSTITFLCCLLGVNLFLPIFMLIFD